MGYRRIGDSHPQVKHQKNIDAGHPISKSFTHLRAILSLASERRKAVAGACNVVGGRANRGKIWGHGDTPEESTYPPS